MPTLGMMEQVNENGQYSCKDPTPYEGEDT